jgi:hypothetical protein
MPAGPEDEADSSGEFRSPWQAKPPAPPKSIQNAFKALCLFLENKETQVTG